MPSGKDGWEVHFAAMTRKEAGENIIMLSVGDHDFDTPSETVEACVGAVRAGYHHYTQLPGIPRLREAMARISTHCTGVATTRRADHRHAGRPGGALLRRAGRARSGRPRDRGRALLRHLSWHVPAAGADFTVVEAEAERRFPAARRGDRDGAEAQHRAILINTPNNPTGAVYSRESLEGIAELCVERDLWLLSDEVYWTLGGGEHVSPRCPARHGRAHAGHQLACRRATA